MEGIRRAAWVWQPPNYLPTEFTEHTETTGGEKNLCTSVKSVGEYPPPEASVNSVKSVGGSSPPEASVNSVKSVGGLAQTNLEWFCGKNSEGSVGMAGMPYPPTKTPTDCTDAHRLGGKTQPKNP